VTSPEFKMLLRENDIVLVPWRSLEKIMTGQGRRAQTTK
jgi:hypothetical protein